MKTAVITKHNAKNQGGGPFRFGLGSWERFTSLLVLVTTMLLQGQVNLTWRRGVAWTVYEMMTQTEGWQSRYLGEHFTSPGAKNKDYKSEMRGMLQSDMLTPVLMPPINVYNHCLLQALDRISNSARWPNRKKKLNCNQMTDFRQLRDWPVLHYQKYNIDANIRRG